jgi:hypothetical protein
MLDLASGTVLTLDGHPHTLYKEPQVTYPIPLLSPAISWAKSTFSIRQAAEYNMMRARENPEEGGAKRVRYWWLTFHVLTTLESLLVRQFLVYILARIGG